MSQRYKNVWQILYGVWQHCCHTNIHCHTCAIQQLAIRHTLPYTAIHIFLYGVWQCMVYGRLIVPRPLDFRINLDKNCKDLRNFRPRAMFKALVTMECHTSIHHTPYAIHCHHTPHTKKNCGHNRFMNFCHTPYKIFV